jgi:hypothetical protein
MGGASSMYVRDEKCTQHLTEGLKEDLEVHGKIMFKEVLNGV